MDKKIINTDIAQLAERFPHMEKVASSILAVGTNKLQDTESVTSFKRCVVLFGYEA